MKQLRLYQCAPLILYILNLSQVVHCEGGDEVIVNHGERLIQWLRENGGIVNEKIEIRRADLSDPTSRFGMFTSGDIKEKEILLAIPRDCLITDVPRDYSAVENDDEDDEDEDDEDEDDEEEEGGTEQCATIRNLIEEMKLGDDSHYAPYVNYLMAEPWGQLPSAWSEQGKSLFHEILESTEDLLPPYAPTSLQDDYLDSCEGSSRDPFEVNAALMVAQRSWDDILIPVFDMMSHRNGKWLNTESSSVHDESTDIVVKARRPIESGGEIYSSYNMCEDCTNRYLTYGTPEILRDYGFVEQYPQRWIFPDAIGFEIDEKDAGSGNLSLSWITEEPDDDDIDLLEDIQEAMAEVAKTKLATPDTAIPSNEIATIRQFHQDLTKATNFALETISDLEMEACAADDEKCVASSTRYDDLTKDKDVFYSELVCGNMYEIMEFKGYKKFKNIESHYQDLSFSHNPYTTDVCFSLDGICQICGNYRPHYHEMSVHYAARYLVSLKRALFVGGGDSMLLHELLQYPSIETVVALELDQTVPRASFKYFGTQPHWDNEKVEWWFGDATKSLTMLPKEYFGSFDMVLVDLSETVMSLTVTKELDVMSALSLLLKPDGIMLKNELYFETMSDIFEHTLQYWYYDVPTICSQSMVLGSNAINFVRHENLTDHNVNNLLIGPIDYDKQFELYHDYAWNPDNRKKNCIREDDELEQVPLSQSNSPGIMMIVEAENTSITIHSINEMKDILTKTLTDEGFNIMSTFVPESDDEDNVVIVVMEEGYVVSHYWPDYKYCGLDIYLWSSFAKHDTLKKALLLAVGSESSSSFRIVAGGMFGTKAWTDDLIERGIRRTLPCNRPENNIVKESDTNSDILQVILEEETKFIKKGATVLVVCGLKSSLPCNTFEKLKNIKNLGAILDVWSCPDMKEFSEGSVTQMYACERDVLRLLRKRLTDGETLDAIVFDSTSSYSMGQIFLRLFTNLATRSDLLAENSKILAISHHTKEEWRSVLVNRFRTDIFKTDPVFKVDVLVEGNNSNIYIHSVVTDQKDVAVKNLRHILAAVEKRSGVHANVVEFLGGAPPYEAYFTPSKVFTSGDYDQTSQLYQWESQRPLGYQSIIQLEVQEANYHLSVHKVKVALEQTLYLVNSIEQPSGTAPVKEISNIGDGCLILALWSESRVIVTWDGRKHVGISLTTNDEDFNFTSEFVETFIKQIPSLKKLLFDEHPRGYGKVISFAEDIEDEDYEPVWA